MRSSWRGGHVRALTFTREHAHLLTFCPRDASPDALQALLDAGWTTDGIVTVSQLVAFTHFQLRVVAGLAVLNRTSPNPAALNLDTQKEIG